jgi:ABC-type uncharacterized transport system ATPase subunit
MGISMVFQHFSLFDTLSVAENVWLGLDRGQTLADVARSIRAKAAEYGLEIDPDRPVHTLSVGEMQRVEIIRALLTQPRLLILDEPTSVLTPQAVEKLFVVLKKLASEGLQHPVHQPQAARDPRTVHRLHRAARRQGHRRVQPGEESNASLSRLMIGAEPPALEHRPGPAAPVLRRAGPEPAARRPVRRGPGRHRPAGARRRGGRHCRCVGQWPEGTDVRAVG